MERSEPIIVCEHVAVSYGRQEVVRDACLEVPRGVLLPFVGPNGAGKTTLLRAILGLLKPSTGAIRTPFADKPAGYVPQQKSIDPLFPVATRRIVEMGLYPELGWWRKPGAEQRRRVDEVLRRLGLEAHQRKTFGELSGGMKQKALLGRALVSGAEVFVMDEPTSELDEETERDVLGHLVALARDEGKTVLLAHHGLDQAAALADRVCVVHHGRVHLDTIPEARQRLAGTGSAGEGGAMDDSLWTLIGAFPNAIAAGLLVGVACALLGVFVILKRVVFIGIALSEIAACGIAGALLAGLPPLLGAILLTLGAVALLAGPFESRRIPRDALLGILFVGAASLSVLLVAGSGHGLTEVKALLYGDLILASRADLVLLAAILGPAIVLLLAFLRPMLYAFLDREAATVLGVRPARWEMLFFLLLGLVVATASKAAGSLLVFCYLIVPPATALLLTRRLGLVLALAAAFAALATLAGIAISFRADWPTNPTICAASVAGLLLALPVARTRRT